MDSDSNDARVNYTKDAQLLVSKIDDKKVFGLGGIRRSQLYLYAVALGLTQGKRTPLRDIYSGGLVVDHSIESSVRSLLFAQVISEALSVNPDIIEEAVDKKYVYRLSDEYANTGFIYLEEIYEKYSEDESAYIFKAIDGLDTLFKRNVGNK